MKFALWKYVNIKLINDKTTFV